MTLTPILNANTAVHIHLATVVVAMGLTAAILTMRKGTGAHRAMGRVWAAMMVITALASFGIDSFDSPYGFSVIHLFSLITLYSVPYAIWSIRRGRVEAHKGAMMGVVFGGIGIAGSLAFLPGRVMHAVLWGA